ncbi:MAG: hypothetical protein ACLUFA_06520, partial [[Clostridium] leptum]
EIAFGCFCRHKAYRGAQQRRQNPFHNASKKFRNCKLFAFSFSYCTPACLFCQEAACLEISLFLCYNGSKEGDQHG